MKYIKKEKKKKLKRMKKIKKKNHKKIIESNILIILSSW